MRKRTMKKRKSCALCKPWKMGKMVRWKEKEFALMKEFERTKQKILG